jgi:D-alanyl-lipoteichoic acid acyltransferase DltB (MBOAT superfamily)
LFLKVFIADNLAKIADPVYASTGPFEGSSVLIATYAFAIQIYCDFAGYSFMAIGLAAAMGIDLMENFRRPYFSLNIADFWRRWHISLSSWFRDYFFSPLYIYMDGSKLLKGYSIKVRHAIVFFATLLFTEYLLGFWHGAGWNYGFFGVYHALAILAYYYTRKYWDRMNAFVRIILTFHIVCGGWLVFRAPTLGQAMDMFNGVFTNFSVASNPQFYGSFLEVLAYSSVLIIVQLFQERHDETLIVLAWPSYVRYAFFALLGSLIVVFGDFGGRPFIYFQF